MCFEKAIKNKDYQTAEQLFLKEVDELSFHGRYDVIRSQTETFPEKFRNNSLLLLYYHTIATHLLFPFSARQKLCALISEFTQMKDLERSVTVYITLLINYLYFDDNESELLSLVEEVRVFIIQNDTTLASHQIKLLNLWMKLGQWWEFLEYEEAFEIGLEAEEVALTLGDDALLIFSRIALTRLNWERGRFHNALSQLKKVERLVKKNAINQQFEPLLHYKKALTYVYLHQYEKAEGEIVKGLRVINDEAVYKSFLNEMMFYCHLGLEKYESCEQLIETILKEYPDKDSTLSQFFLFVGQMLLAYKTEDKDKVGYYCNRLIQLENKRIFYYEYPLTYLHYAEACIFIEDYETALNILAPLLEELSEDNFPHPLAACHALLGVVFLRKKENKQSQVHFKNMSRIVIDKNVEALEIISSKLLREIISQSKLKVIAPSSGFDFSRNETTTYPVTIHSLGPYRVIVAGKPLADNVYYQQSKVFSLLSLLIVNRKTGIHREVIFDILWRDHDLKSARNNLNVNLSKLRKIIDVDFISSDGAMICLTEGKYWLDVNEFENQLQQGERALQSGLIQQALTHFENAKALFTGEFMAHDPYSDFIISERESLNQKYCNLLFNCIKLYLSQGNYSYAVDYGKQMIESNPYSESGYRLLMIAIALSGNKSELPALVNQLKASLKKELDIEIDVATQALIQKLYKGEIPTQSMWKKECLV